MTRTKELGKQASRWGCQTAPKIAEKIGAQALPGPSNKYTYNGQTVLIKSANPGNDKVGALYHILPDVDMVIGAFKSKDGLFHLWGLLSDVYCKHMRNTDSKGKSRDQNGMVKRADFEKHGRFITTVRLD